MVDRPAQKRYFTEKMQRYKGHLISKWFIGVIDFLQKTNERIQLYYYENFFRRKSKESKKRFEIIWPLESQSLYVGFEFTVCLRKPEWLT